LSQVLLAGDLSVRDPGDDALVSAFSRGLPEHEMVLVTSGESPGRDHRGHRLISMRDRGRVFAALRQAQILILGDGALHGSQRPVLGRNRARIRNGLHIGLAAKALGRRVALLGVGAGGLQRGADRTRASMLVRLSDLLILRDPSTADELAAAGAPGPFRVAADPIWCAAGPSVKPAREKPAREQERGPHDVLVILDADTLLVNPAIAVRLAAACDRLAAGGLRIRLAPWRVGATEADDLDLARAVAARMGAQARVLLPPADFAQARSEAARAQVVLGLRRHALIAGAGVGTAAVTMTDEPETVSLGRRLGQASLPLTAAPEAIAASVTAATQQQPAGADAIQHERAAAQEAFRLLRLLIEADESEEDRHLAALPLMPEGTEPSR
jgi:polysaccharide pyruvyl transferase WcaK-like protein